MEEKTIDEINQEFQDFQDVLTAKEKHLKLPTAWDKEDIEKLLLLLQQPDHIDLL